MGKSVQYSENSIDDYIENSGSGEYLALSDGGSCHRLGSGKGHRDILNCSFD